MSGFLRRFFVVLLVIAACFAGVRIYAANTGSSSSLTYTLYDDGAKIAAVPHSWAIGSVAQLSTLPYKPGYGFAGYYTGSSCSGDQIIDYQGNVLFSLNASTTLYACWIPYSPPSVVLDDAGGSGGRLSSNGCSGIYRLVHGEYVEFASHLDWAIDDYDNKHWLIGCTGTDTITSMYQLPTRSGYTFKGYYTGQNGTGTQIIYQNGTLVGPTSVYSTLSANAPTTIYAYWEYDYAGHYLITLNDAGGSGGQVSSLGTGYNLYESYGECYKSGTGIDPLTGELLNGRCITTIYQAPTKTGYDFGGYYTGQNGSGVQIVNSSRQVDNTKSTQFTAPGTIYAKWTPKVLTVTLNHNGATNSPSPSTVYLKYATGWYSNSGATTSITHMTTVPTKTNYTFGGYWTGQNGSGTRVIDTDGDFIYTTAALTALSTSGTVYAYWVSSGSTPNWISVTLNDSSPTTYSSPRTIYRNTNANTERSCSGWRASASCNATEISSITPPTKSDNVYGGHYTASGGSGTQVISDTGVISTTYLPTSNATIYAKWTSGGNTTNRTITLSPNNRAAGNDQTIYERYLNGWYRDTNGSLITASIFAATNLGGAGLTKPTRTDYTFNGYWDTTATSGGTQIIDADGNILVQPTYNDNQTFYARWSQAPSVVTLDKNATDATNCAVTSVTAINGSPMPTLSCAPTRTGYVFDGYWDATSDGVKYYNADRTSARNWDKTGAQTLYAHWQPTVYDVIYYCTKNDLECYYQNPNSPDCHAYHDVATYNQSYVFKTRAFLGCAEKPNEKFLGWVADDTGSSIYYQPGQVITYTFTSDKNFSGAYSPIVPVTLNHGNPNNTPSYDTVYFVPYDGWYENSGATRGAIFTTLPEKYGYRFTGYWNASSGGTKVIDTDGDFLVNAFDGANPSTLYARYAANEYDVTLGDVGATTAAVPQELTYDAERGWRAAGVAGAITSITEPTKTGYYFDGYYSGTNGTGIQIIDDSGTLLMNSNILQWLHENDGGTIYANWVMQNTVTFSCENQAGNGSGTPNPATVQIHDGETLTFPSMANCSWGNAGYSPYKWGVVSGNTFTDTHEAGDTITYDSSWGDRTYNMWYAPNYFNYEYSCGTGSGTPPANDNTYYHNGGWKTAVNTCTPPANKHFVGWLEPVSGVTYAENTTPTGGGWIWTYDVTAAAGGAFVAQYADDTYSARFNCSVAQVSGTDKPAFINPSTGLENITGIAAGSTVVLPSTSLCEFNSSEFDSCAQLSCFTPTPGSKWTYSTGSAYPNVSGEFTWPSNNDIGFSLRGFSINSLRIRYRCGQAGFADGVTPTGDYVNSTINFTNCGNVVISNNICNTPAHATFAGWTVSATGGIGAFSVGQTVQPGALSNPQLNCDTGVNTYLDAKWECESGYAWNQTTGTCDELYTAHFTCENNTLSPYVFSGTAPADITDIAYQSTITLPSPNVCTNNYPDAGWIVSPATEWLYSCTDGNGGALGGGTAGAGSWTWPKQGNCSFRPNALYSTYHIYYYCDGTTNTVSLDQTVNYTNRDTVRPATVSAAGCSAPTGHHFTGWKVGTTNTILQPGQYGGNNALWPYAQSTTLRAQWEPDTYNLTWSCGAGSGTPSGAAFPTTINYGDTLTFSANTACTAPTGYEFAGWTVDYLAHTYSVGEQLLWNLTSGSPVIASFTPVKVNITYSCGAGATGAPSKATDDNINYGGQVTLATLGTCAKTGHTADKWVVSNTSPAASYNFGATVNPWNYAENKTLTPNWSAQTYTITYELNGGTPASSGMPTSYTYGTTTTINGVPTLVGAEFAGWCDTESLTNCAMTKTISATATGNKKFWAKWTCKTGYESNDIWLTAPVTVSDYSASGQTVYPAGAACIPGRYHINCNGNGGVACLEQVTSGNASNPQLHLGQFYGVRAAYGTGYDIVPGLATVLSTTQSDIESIINNNDGFYAFTRNPAYKTQVGANAAYTASTYQGFIEAYANLYNSSAVFGRDHYTFNGLWNAAEGGTQYLAPNTNFENLINTEAFSKSWLSDTTVYAQWIPDVYTILLDGQGYDGTLSAVYETYNTGWSQTLAGTPGAWAQLTAAQMASKPGYTLLGYYSTASGDGTKYINGDGTLASGVTPTTFGESTTLHARFQAITYNVTYLCGTGATGTAPAATTAAYNANFTPAPVGGCTNPGRSFNGWLVVGFNLYDSTATTDNKYYNDSLVYTDGDNTKLSYYMPVVAGQTYTWKSSMTQSGGNIRINWFDKDRNILSQNKQASRSEITLTAPADAAYARFSYSTAYYGPEHVFARASSVPTMTAYESSDNREANITFQWQYVGGDKTFIAQWTDDTYTITFHPGDDVTTTGTTEIWEWYSHAYRRPSNGSLGWGEITEIELPTKTGYTFAGYYDNPSFTGTPVMVDATLPVTTPTATYFTADADLYAKWTKTGYTITYKNGGGTGDDVVQDVTYDTQFTTMSGTIFAKTNSVVTKWNTTSGGTYPNLHSNYPYSTAGNTVLTANWGACTCTKGNHVASCNVTGVANNTCQYSYSCEAGYNNAGATSGTFNGIPDTAANTSPNCGGANSYTITVTAGNGISKVAASGWTNSGTTTMTKTFDFGDPIDLSSVVTATRKVGYTGVKYENTSGAGSISGNVYTVGAGNGTITVSAVGITEPVIDLGDDTTQVYNYQATTLTASNSTQYDTGITLQYSFKYSNSADGVYEDTESDSNTLSIAKNEFLGTRYYKVMVSATDGVITSGPGVSNVVAVTLDQKEITFDATTNGGTLSGTSPLYVRYDSANVYTGATSNTTGTVPTATKSGYTFNGWYTEQTGGSQIYNASRTLTSATVSGWTGSSKWRATEDKTLYAQFSANTYSIAYTLNGGAYGASHPASATFDAQFTVNNPTHEHATFTGWNISGMDTTTHTYGNESDNLREKTGVTATTFKNLLATAGTVTFTATWNCDTGYAGTNCDAIDYNMQYVCEAEPGWNYTGSAPVATNPVHYGQPVQLAGDVYAESDGCRKVWGSPNDADYCDNCFTFGGWTIDAESTALADPDRTHDANSTVDPWGRTYTTDWCIISDTGDCAGFADDIFYVRPNYTPKQYNIEYMYATGPVSGASANMPASYTYTTEKTISNADQTAPAHATFNGWCTGANGTGICFAAGQTITIGNRDHGDKRYYANWSCDTGYTLTYDANDQPVCSASSITCDPTQYLPAGATVCVDCIAGGYCPGGTFTYNPNLVQGITVCAANTYSNAAAAQCTACLTVNGYQNSGDEFADHAYESSCKTTCAVGQCVATARAACANVGTTGWATGGNVPQGNTLACNVCPTGEMTIGYGVGANESGDCGRVLHVGDSQLYLRSDRKTDKTLNFKIGTKVYYANMSTDNIGVSHGATKALKLRFNNTTYSAYDDSALE